MKYMKFLLLFALLLLASGCAKTKFNRGFAEIPGDLQRHLDRDMDRFLSLEDDIARKTRYSYEKTVDAANDVARWTSEEWGKTEDNLDWLMVKTGQEFEVLREAGAYIKKRWQGMGPKVKGLWRDTYSFISYELEHTSSLDDDLKKYVVMELNRTDGAKKGFQRWADHRREEWFSLRKWVIQSWSRETEKGEEALKRLKDYFTKEIK
ncbi:MAG: hypothetical protein Kow00107_06070 [Planctomycetota bacterium]